jgi:hypothetical protein
MRTITQFPRLLEIPARKIVFAGIDVSDSSIDVRFRIFRAYAYGLVKVCHGFFGLADVSVNNSAIPVEDGRGFRMIESNLKQIDLRPNRQYIMIHD